FQPEPAEHRRDLRPAAVHHHRVDADQSQEHHVGGERALEFRVDHRVAAVLDDHRAAGEAREPGQRLDERAGLAQRDAEVARPDPLAHVEYAEFSWTYASDRSLVATVARAEPACRSTATATARPDRSTVDLSAPAAPPTHTGTPLTLTSTSSGSNAAAVVPMADRMRPQFGSLPKNAVLTRLLRAMARPTSTASSSLAAFTTAIWMSFVDPSASDSNWAARSAHAAV